MDPTNGLGRRGSISLLAAVGVHATPIALASFFPTPSMAPALLTTRFDEIDVWMIEPTMPAEAAATAPSQAESPPQGPSASVAAIAPAPERANGDEVFVAQSDALTANLTRSSDAPDVEYVDRGAVDLGLDGGISLREAFDKAPAHSPLPAPSERLLQDGLAQRDGELGVGRASPMLRTVRRLAFAGAPAEGTAVIEISTDKHGVVQAVQLVGSVVERDRWQRLVDVLLQQLAALPLQVPHSANGEVTTIRIDRGPFAKSPGERWRTMRRAAVGQEPEHPRVSKDESTRTSFETGQLAPTLGVAFGGGNAPATRVVLLGSRAH